MISLGSKAVQLIVLPVMSTTVDGVFVIIADSDEGSPNDADNAARDKDMSCYTCLCALYRS